MNGSKGSETEKTMRVIRYTLYGIGLAFLTVLLLSGLFSLMKWWSCTHPPEVKVVSLPYALTYDGMRVTFEKVYFSESYTSVDEYKVVLRYKNTLHESNSNYYLPGILQLKTDKGNVYEIEEYEPDGCFRPEEERIVEGYSWVNKGEKPVALVYYKEIWGNYLPVLEIRIPKLTSENVSSTKSDEEASKEKMARIGDTILIRMNDGTKFDLTLNSWRIEPDPWCKNEVVVILNVTIRNSYSKTEEETPSLFGAVVTEKGYEVGWDRSGLYCPTRDDPDKVCPFDLLPGESITGELRIYGIPKNWKPVKVIIGCHYGEVSEVVLLQS